MSIGMQRFAAEGQFQTYDPYGVTAQQVAVFQLQCRQCGFEPEGVTTAPRLCPKCHGKSWERFTRPGGILENADRYRF